MQNVSIEHTRVIINGHACRGWADEEDALQFPDIDLATVKFGPDGQMLGSSTGMRGGEVVLKFLPNSASTRFFMQQVARIQRGAVVQWEGTSQNSQTGVTTRFERGILTRAPLGQSQGSDIAPNREFAITFESIISNFDAARTAEPPPIG